MCQSDEPHQLVLLGLSNSVPVRCLGFETQPTRAWLCIIPQFPKKRIVDTKCRRPGEKHKHNGGDKL